VQAQVVEFPGHGHRFALQSAIGPGNRRETGNGTFGPAAALLPLLASLFNQYRERGEK
jgi:hypothetical protein